MASMKIMLMTDDHATISITIASRLLSFLSFIFNLLVVATKTWFNNDAQQKPYHNKKLSNYQLDS